MNQFPIVLAKVVARSTNTNSFGLREHVVVIEKTGEAFTACRSAYVPDADAYKQDSVFELRPDPRSLDRYTQLKWQISLHGFEIVQSTTGCPAKVLKEIDFSQK